MNYNMGYACYNKELKTTFKKGNIKKFNELSTIEEQRDYVRPLIKHNLEMTLRIMNWNAWYNIKLYRFTSNMIPFADTMKWQWWKDTDILELCKKIRIVGARHDIQTSLHPDQFVVLTNFVDEDIFNRSHAILNGQYRIAQLLGASIILIHVGGAYGDKERAVATFMDNFRKLRPRLQQMMALENDDTTYNVEEVLDICNKLSIPMVCDIHHDKILKSKFSLHYYVSQILNTWRKTNVRPKMHLSSGLNGEHDRKHAEYITIEDFNDAMLKTGGYFDLMLECKMKEKSILKIMEDRVCV